MANTYELISKQTLPSNQSTVTFSSIPATYTDLKFIISARNTSGSTVTGLNMALNGNAITTGLIMVGSGTAGFGASNPSSSVSGGSGTTSGFFSNSDIYIFNYRSTIAKVASGDSSVERFSSEAYAVYYANLYNAPTSAVNTVSFTMADGSNIFEASDFYLYGISNS